VLHISMDSSLIASMETTAGALHGPTLLEISSHLVDQEPAQHTNTERNQRTSLNVLIIVETIMMKLTCRAVLIPHVKKIHSVHITALLDNMLT
jgi:hypothetical protein